MWNLTAYDVNRIKGQLQARRARIDAKYAEETKALDADFADVETLERVATALAVKYQPDASADIPQESESPDSAEDDSPRVEIAAALDPQLAASSGDASSTDPKHGSRWRLALRDRPAATEAE
jgi:hypothetical protein